MKKWKLEIDDDGVKLDAEFDDFYDVIKVMHNMYCRLRVLISDYDLLTLMNGTWVKIADGFRIRCRKNK